MKIKDFKEKYFCGVGGEVSDAPQKDFNLERFGITAFRLYVCGDLSIKEGFSKTHVLVSLYYEGAKRISETQFKNRIKNL